MGGNLFFDLPDFFEKNTVAENNKLFSRNFFAILPSICSHNQFILANRKKSALI